MTAKSYLRGHEIEYNGKEWVYSDTQEPTEGNERDCGHCGLPNTKDGHDACIANLPGVINACCGHGHDRAYVQFENGKIIRGRFDND